MENEAMSDAIKNLTEMLGKDTIPENLKDILGSLNHSSNDSSNTSNVSTPSDASSSKVSPETLSSLLGMLQSNSSDNANSSTSNSSTNSGIDIEMLLKLKTVMEKMNASKNDPRSNLLLSLKPYLNESRQSKVEQYVKLLNMSKVMEAFNESGGDHSHA